MTVTSRSTNEVSAGRPCTSFIPVARRSNNVSRHVLDPMPSSSHLMSQSEFRSSPSPSNAPTDIMNPTLPSFLFANRITRKGTKPTASGLDKTHLHPAIYTYLEPIANLDALATLIGAPYDWEAQCAKILSIKGVLNRFNDLHNLPDDCPKAYVDSAFNILCSRIDTELGIRVTSLSQTKVVVEGFLALANYDFKSTTDTCYIDKTMNQYLIASEITTARSFKDGDLWYLKSRGRRLFVENKERNKVFTMPFNPEEEEARRPHVSADMNTFFVRVLTICLLAPTSGDNDIAPVSEDEGVATIVEDEPLTIKNLHQTSTPHKQQQQNTRYSSSISKPPSFQTGVDLAGKPVYQVIRVSTAEEVKEVEAEERREIEESNKIALVEAV
ncbi:hypothetical protein HDU76_001740 [Blyttiomyces sp. JEL0837]|nr:hypothetical protein HDU76_001740 [Blyttiomyces sp. JEL0837]